MGARLADELLAALPAQTVTVPGTKAAETVLPKLADSLKVVLLQRKQIAEDIEEMFADHPLAEVLTSMPGIGVRTGTRILLEVGDATGFASAGHLASYAGIAPITHRSGSSIRGEHPARSGNHKLKRALFLSAFAALHDPASRAYYDKTRAEGKKHNAALICLARRRCDVLLGMLRNKQPYRTPGGLNSLTNTIGTPPPGNRAKLIDFERSSPTRRICGRDSSPGPVRFWLTTPRPGSKRHLLTCDNELPGGHIVGRGRPACSSTGTAHVGRTTATRDPVNSELVSP
jgi:hypothetical protein